MRPVLTRVWLYSTLAVIMWQLGYYYQYYTLYQYSVPLWRQILTAIYYPYVSTSTNITRDRHVYQLSDQRVLNMVARNIVTLIEIVSDVSEKTEKF